MLHHLAGATIQVANSVNYNGHPLEMHHQEDGNKTMATIRLVFIGLTKFFLKILNKTTSPALNILITRRESENPLTNSVR